MVRAADGTVTSTAREIELVFRKPDGAPLPENIKVHVFDANGEVTAATDGLKVSAGGIARIAGLKAGRYDVWIEPRADVSGKIFRGLEVLPGNGPQKLDLQVPVATSLHGRLTLHDGRTPAAGYRVAVQSGTRAFADSKHQSDIAAYARGAQDAYAETITVADGTFKLDGLAPGEYRLDVMKAGESVPCGTIPFAIAASDQTKDIGTWPVPQNRWQWLFDHRLQHGGAPSKYFGSGEIKTENERLTLGSGEALTGVTWTENLPRVDYEISLDAMRAAGQDFFCGLTFPVEKSSLSFIVGGWSGSVVGLSNIDWMSAVENETTKTRTFETGRWYRIRLRVTKVKVEAWIDDEKMVDLPTRGRQLSIRSTVEESLPLGIATWHTTAWLRDIRLRRLDDFETAAVAATVPVQEEF